MSHACFKSGFGVGLDLVGEACSVRACGFDFGRGSVCVLPSTCSACYLYNHKECHKKKDVVNGTAVELFEDLRAHDKSFVPPEGKRHCRAVFTTVLVCLDRPNWNLKLSTVSTPVQ